MKAELGNMGRKGLGALVGLVLVVLIAAAAADARTALFRKPTRQQTAPRAACGHSTLYSSGSPPREVPSPGRPGLSARATSKWSAVVTWRVSRSAPSKCKTVALLVSLGNYEQWLPTTKQVRTHGRFSGTVRLSVSPTERPSDTVIATAFGPKSLGRSGIAGVLIRR
jgi:hypothetical protein